MSKYNILIPFSNALDPISGGVERVYHNLVPTLRKNGCSIYATYNIKSDYDTSSVYTETFYMGDISMTDTEYRKKWDLIIRDKQINIVICPYPNLDVFDYFSQQSQLKVFFHIHNVPSKIMYQSMAFMPSFLKNTYLDNILKWLRYRIRFKKYFDRINKNEMKVVLLSDKFRQDLKSFCTIDDKNILAIPNPIVLDDKIVNVPIKEKTILYVGRINSGQKRFQSLLNIWGKLQMLLPHYQLEVVGGGEEKAFYENKVKEMKLQRIHFHGFQTPNEYYKKADAFCMVSNYEGFGMVLLESMQYGCVPFAFNSFAALSDIIDNGKNGFAIPPFDEDKYVSVLFDFLQKTEEEKRALRQACIGKAKCFSVENIAKIWLDLFKS